MKKILLILIMLFLTIVSFAASELDELLKDDEAVFSELESFNEELEPKEAYVEELAGQAFLQHEESDKWFQIVQNSTIKEKDTVLTMENTSMKIRMEDETYINVSAKSKLYFTTMRGEPESELLTETGLKLAWGKVFSNVRKKLEKGGRYEIEVGSVVAGVRGTQFDVGLDKKGKANVKVYEGNVFVVPVEVYVKQRQAERRAKQEQQEKEKAVEEDSDKKSDDESAVEEEAAKEKSDEEVAADEKTDEEVAADEENDEEKSEEEKVATEENPEEEKIVEEADTGSEETEKTVSEEVVVEKAVTEEVVESVKETVSAEVPVIENSTSEEVTNISPETETGGSLFGSQEIIVSANEEINVAVTGSIGEIAVHHDVAPTKIVKTSVVQEQIKEIKQTAVEVLDIKPEEVKDDEAVNKSEEEATDEEKEEEVAPEEALVEQPLELETIIEELVVPVKQPETVVTEIPRGKISVEIK